MHKLVDLAKPTGLELRLDKCVVFARDKASADACKKSAPPGVDIRESMDKAKVLKVPIGSDEEVRKCLDEKLVKLKEKVDAVVAMPYKHEAATLLQWCGSRCRVVHLMRTIPPRLSEPFVQQFDGILRKGLEKLVGAQLDENQWRVARLPAKYGGMNMRSGANTLGAQYSVSVVKNAEQVSKFVDGVWDPVVQIRRDS